MAITPQYGFKIDPNNPNGVVRDTVIPVSTLTSNPQPLNVQTSSPTPPVDVSNIPITTPPTPTATTTPTPSDFTTKLETLTAGLLGRDITKEQKIAEATADYQKSLNELNTQIKIHQANALARQEEALKSGETLRFASGTAQNIARTDAIEAMKLSALAQGMQGNILLATKQAENAVNAEFAQQEKDIATARQNILNNYDTFTDAEKKRADNALLTLDEKDAFVAKNKADREQAYKTAMEAAKNGLTDTSLLTQIQNSTPEKALELASPYLKEEKPVIKDYEVGGRLVREVIDPMTGKTISKTDLGAKEGMKPIKEGKGGAISPEILLATSKANVDSIQNILNSGGLSISVGTSFLTRSQPGFFRNVGKFFTGVGAPEAIKGVYKRLTGEQQDFIASIEQIRSQLNLDKLIQSKAQGATFGALSDNELQVLASAGTKLGTWAVKDGDGKVVGYNASESAFKKEMDKINNFAKLDYIIKGGNPADVNAKIMPDGAVWTVNSDGTYTQIK